MGVLLRAIVAPLARQLAMRTLEFAPVGIEEDLRDVGGVRKGKAPRNCPEPARSHRVHGS